MSTVHYQSCNLQNKVILVYIWATRPLISDFIPVERWELGLLVPTASRNSAAWRLAFLGTISHNFETRCPASIVVSTAPFKLSRLEVSLLEKCNMRLLTNYYRDRNEGNFFLTGTSNP